MEIEESSLNRAVSTASGLYENKPASPTVGDLYVATDKSILLLCVVSGSWIIGVKNILASGDLKRKKLTTQADISETVYTLMDEYTMNQPISGSVRISFEGAYLTAVSYAQLHKNNVAVGVERTLTTSWVLYSEDFNIDLVKGDKLQLMGRGASGGSASGKNFTLLYDEVNLLLME